MLDNIKPKEATAIINSLLGGVVPKLGVQHITVGRSPEIAAFLSSLDEVKNGHSMSNSGLVILARASRSCCTY